MKRFSIGINPEKHPENILYLYFLMKMSWRFGWDWGLCVLCGYMLTQNAQTPIRFLIFTKLSVYQRILQNYTI